VREWFAAGPLGIEQGFTVARRPAGVGGRLTLRLGVRGNLTARGSGSGVVFNTRSGLVALRYGGLVAVDASGRRLPARLAAEPGGVWITVLDRGLLRGER
jgi:hypothetical protein